MTYGKRPAEQELIELVESCIEGTATEADWARLNERMRTDSEVRRYYLAHVQVHATMLRTLAGGDMAAAEEQRHDSSVAIVRKFSWRYVRGRAIASLTRPTPLSMTVAALVVGLLVTSMAFVAAPIYLRFARTNGAHEAQRTIARLGDSVDAVWAKTQPPRPESTKLLVGERLELVSGLVEVEFDSGAKIVLQGPAVLDVSTEKSCRLDHGSLVAFVPPQAVGFEVRTFIADLLDLGTEFGVRTASKGGTSVEVFAGRIEVQINHRDAKSKPLLVNAGESLEILLHRPLDAVPVKRETTTSFVRTLPSLEDKFPPPTPYTELVTSLRPALYFRMEPSEPKVLFDSSERSRHGVLRTRGVGAEAFVDGVDGKSLALRGNELGDCGLVARYPMAEEDKLTVALWAYAEEHDSWANFVTNWGDSASGQFHFGIHHDGDLAVFVNDRQGSPISARQNASKPFPRKSWQHVAFVVDGRNLKLFLNGQMVATTPCDGLTTSSLSHVLGIGTKTSDDGAKLSQEPAGLWFGRLDELAIFHRALSDEDIYRLSQTVKAK